MVLRGNLENKDKLKGELCRISPSLQAPAGMKDNDAVCLAGVETQKKVPKPSPESGRNSTRQEVRTGLWPSFYH